MAKSYIVDGKETTYDQTDVNEGTLFLRTLYFNTKFAGNETLKQWFEFLQNSVYINAFERKVISYGKEEFVLTSYIKEKGPEEINDFFAKYHFGQEIAFSNEYVGDNLLIRMGNEQKMIFFKRKGVETPIPYTEESLGNQTLLNMLPSFLNLTTNHGMLLIDEFSSGFHNELEELLIKYFMQNSDSSQIIFVSHSTNLLSTSLLRPDQIYSVNFDEDQGSWLKRFSTEQPRLAQNIEKMYLSGVFEGLPEYDED